MRLNFSHSTHDDHAQTFERVRRVAERMGSRLRSCRTCKVPRSGPAGWSITSRWSWPTSAALTITTRDIVGAGNVVSTTYQNLPQDVHADDCILIDDGNIELHVLDVQRPGRAHPGGARRDAGRAQGHQPARRGRVVPALTAKDREDLAFGLAAGRGLRGASASCAAPRTCSEAKDLIAQRAGDTVPIIAKLEKPRGARKPATRSWRWPTG